MADYSDLSSDGVGVDLLQVVLGVEKDLASGDGIVLFDELYDSAFAGSTLSNKCHILSPFNFERHPLQHNRLGSRVLKLYILELDCPFKLDLSAILLINAALIISHFKNFHNCKSAIDDACIAI